MQRLIGMDNPKAIIYFNFPSFESNHFHAEIWKDLIRVQLHRPADYEKLLGWSFHSAVAVEFAGQKEPEAKWRLKRVAEEHWNKSRKLATKTG